MLQATHARPEIETVRYSVVRIEVVRGPDVGLTIERAGCTLKIGTGDMAELQLTDPAVSREHCELVLHERGFRVRDCDSTNGVRVQGLRIYDIAASSTLEIAIGDSVLRVTPQAADEKRERTSSEGFGRLVGSAPAMRELFALMARIAPSDLNVLIQGETGTGKELVARSLHEASARSQQPYVVFDCSVASENLIESDLFGHERGAFTGATATRIGALEEADGGTLFLDEIGDLPSELQLKLLRGLQEGEYRRVGSRKVFRTDVRVIAATNRDLRADVAAQRFREDLYYRLEEVTLRVPPLRERREDIGRLAQHFVAQASTHTELPASALQMFATHRWPGNVRELRNFVRRMLVVPELALPIEPAVVATTADKCELARCVDRIQSWQAADEVSIRDSWLPLAEARRDLTDAFEQDYLLVLKRLSGGNKRRAGEWADVTAEAIRKLVQKHDYAWKDGDEP